MINNNITVVVVEIRGDNVRLGVEADKSVPVHRKEVYEAIKRDEMLQRDAKILSDLPKQSTGKEAPGQAS